MMKSLTSEGSKGSSVLPASPWRMLRASSRLMRKLAYGPISMSRKEKSLASPFENRMSPKKMRSAARPLPSDLGSRPFEGAVSALTLMDIAP